MPLIEPQFMGPGVAANQGAFDSLRNSVFPQPVVLAWPYFLWTKNLIFRLILIPAGPLGLNPSLLLMRFSPMLKPLANSLLRPALLLVVWGTVAPCALASEYSFFVTNNTRTNIVKIQTQMLGGPWGDFDLGGAIRPGEHVELHWAESSNDQSCTQFVRAKFSDGSSSKPSKFNFCSKPDIEFH